MGLIFLKYISDSFEEMFARLQAGKGEYKGADPEDKDEYKAENVFFVPSEARWSYLVARAKLPTIIYRSSQRDCATCPMKARCCPNTAVRKIARSLHENARDVARQIATTPEYQRSRCERKKVEMLFAHLKSILKLNRLRLRGLSGAADEFTLAATVQNLRRMAKLLAHGPPIDRIGAPA